MDGTRFAARAFRWGAVYGAIVLAPLYLLPLPERGAEVFLGFVGVALVFQGVFWVIGGDPRRYRALMPLSVAEKLVFAVPALALTAQGRVAMPLPVFAAVDVALGALFLIAWRRTPATPA